MQFVGNLRTSTVHSETMPCSFAFLSFVGIFSVLGAEKRSKGEMFVAVRAIARKRRYERGSFWELGECIDIAVVGVRKLVVSVQGDKIA